jgi:crotonobetainyl-CoA:carnitine CoA-transferase CaiB-like acyl-CoA transferase
VPKLSEVLGLADLTQDPRFDDFWKRVNNRKEMDQVLEDALLEKTTAEWIEIMGKADLWCGEVNTLQQAFKDPQIVHNKMVSTVDSPVGPMHLVSPPYKLSKTPATVRTPAPKLGQHTDEILAFAGYSDAEIAAFHDEGVV